jgi:hypothetical protein
MPEMCAGRVRNCSVKPAARVGITGLASEDLERKARPQATPLFKRAIKQWRRTLDFNK